MHFGRLNVQFVMKPRRVCANVHRAPRNPAQDYSEVDIQLRLYPYHVKTPCPFLPVR
jgi:hypothetical protein